MIRPLFVIGASRSGTTAVMEYMNQHEEILIGRERYKRNYEQMDPALLTFERMLDYEPRREGGETNIPREYHVDLLANKDPSKLKWIGDKQPAGSKRYRAISRNNPGAHFLITYRPIEEVVESVEDRTKELDNPVFGGKDGLKLGVEAWNRAMTSAREYLETYDEPNGLVVSYHDFFYNNESYTSLLSEFLEIDFDDSILETWSLMSREFEGHRREKAPMTEEKAEYIRKNKDHALEEWVQERIARQWVEPGLYKRTVGKERGRQRLAAGLTREREQEKAEAGRIQRFEHRIGQLQDDLASERGRVATAEKRRQSLDAQRRKVRASRSWELLRNIDRIRSVIGRSAQR